MQEMQLEGPQPSDAAASLSYGHMNPHHTTLPQQASFYTDTTDKKIQTGKADLHLGQLEVGIDANEGAGLQGQG